MRCGSTLGCQHQPATSPHPTAPVEGRTPLPPHEPDLGRTGHPKHWCERCRIEAAAFFVLDLRSAPIRLPRTFAGWRTLAWLTIGRCPRHHDALHDDPWSYGGEDTAYAFCCDGIGMWPRNCAAARARQTQRLMWWLGASTTYPDTL